VQLNKNDFLEILKGCKLNDRKSQKQVYSIFYGYAMSVALRYSNSYDNAIEMVNDGFLKVFRDLKNFVPQFESVEASFRAWLRRIVVNSCIDHIRKYHKKEISSVSLIDDITIVDDKENGIEMLQYKEILKCIQQLSPAYKTVFNLFVLDGFSHEEIAKKLKISVSTSKSNLFKARHNLQVLVKKNNVVEYERAV
jgi:RNA polymerase sigma factor (sigma-70 family)